MGSKILIVEDELVVANDLKESLSHLGHTVVGIATTADDAVRRAAAEKPDLILMDIRLAGNRDGVSAALELRARFQASVIFLTAYADSQTIERAKPVEPLAYITKPFKSQDLISAVELALYRVSMENERNEAARTILFYATHDALTGLLNRNEFLTRLTLAVPRNETGEKYGALVFYDLTDFKRINDAEGHGIGDTVLWETGRRINAALTNNEYACRWGGDEFLLFIKNCPGDRYAEERAKNIAEAIHERHQSGVELDVDFGWVFGLNQFPNIAAAINEADKRLYAAKRERAMLHVS